MRNQGTCPRCGERIDLGFGPPPPTGSCEACRQRYLVVVPLAEETEPEKPETAEPEAESTLPGDVRELELLARREPPRAARLREARGLGRSAFRSIHALVAGEFAMAFSIPPLLLGAWFGLRIAPGPPGAELAP